MFKQLYTSVGAAFQSVPFPFIHIHHPASLQSTGTTPLLTTSLQMSVTHFTPASPAAFNISAATPDGPAALPLFALDIAELTSDLLGRNTLPLTIYMIFLVVFVLYILLTF